MTSFFSFGPILVSVGAGALQAPYSSLARQGTQRSAETIVTRWKARHHRTCISRDFACSIIFGCERFLIELLQTQHSGDSCLRLPIFVGGVFFFDPLMRPL